MVLPDPTSNRMRSLRNATTSVSANNPAILGLSMLFPQSLLDISGSNDTMSADAAIQLIQSALFRY
jgi:hypothetical protein